MGGREERGEKGTVRVERGEGRRKGEWRVKRGEYGR